MLLTKKLLWYYLLWKMLKLNKLDRWPWEWTKTIVEQVGLAYSATGCTSVIYITLLKLARDHTGRVVEPSWWYINNASEVRRPTTKTLYLFNCARWWLTDSLAMSNQCVAKGGNKSGAELNECKVNKRQNNKWSQSGVELNRVQSEVKIYVTVY